MYSSPSRIAVVRRLPASDPDGFSDSPKATRSSPEAIPGRYFCFCSSVPPRTIGKEPRAFTEYTTPNPPHALDICSTTRHISRTPVPWPPYSSGIQIPMSS
jgi:hypothetical protein